MGEIANLSFIALLTLPRKRREIIELSVMFLPKNGRREKKAIGPQGLPTFSPSIGIAVIIFIFDF